MAPFPIKWFLLRDRSFSFNLSYRTKFSSKLEIECIKSCFNIYPSIPQRFFSGPKFRVYIPVEILMTYRTSFLGEARGEPSISHVDPVGHGSDWRGLVLRFPAYGSYQGTIYLTPTLECFFYFFSVEKISCLSRNFSHGCNIMLDSVMTSQTFGIKTKNRKKEVQI